MLDLRYVILTCVLYSLRRQSDLTVQSMTTGGCRDVEVVPNVTLADLEGVSYYLKYTSIILKNKIDGMKFDIFRADKPPNNFTEHYTFINDAKEIKILKSWGILTVNDEGVNQILNPNVTENYYILSFVKNEHALIYICNPRVPISIDARVLYTTNIKLNMDEAVHIDNQNNFIGELKLLPNKNIHFLMEQNPDLIEKSNQFQY